VADPQPTEPVTPPIPKPAGLWGMILTATPVALTALATAFAGLSSSEMTQAMYHRSLAAQHQSRAGNQWAFFQAKRIRGNGIESSIEILQALGHPEPFDPSKVIADLTRLHTLVGQLPRPAAAGPRLDVELVANKIEVVQTRLGQLKNTALGLPTIVPTPLPDPGARQAFEEAVQAIQKRKTEAETAALVVRLGPETVDEAIRLAEDDADRFDQACEPNSETVKQLRTLFNELGAAVRPLRGGPGPAAEVVALFDRLDASLRAAAMDYEARRYRQEAAFNRRAAEAYEVRVRRSGIESDRHRERSKQFFYSMLLAQVGVTVSSLALAKAQRSWLWFFAALVAVVSLGFTGYVYLSY
jgi:hypothetical protein